MKLLGFACILLSFVSQVCGKLIQASVEDDVNFPLSEECKEGRGTLYKRLDDDSTQLVASLDGLWKLGPQFQDRVNQSSHSLILKSADFNDEAHYEFTCNGKDEEAYKLEVFLPREVVVSEGEDATLPCRSVTAGQSMKSVRWRRDGEVVLELNAVSGEIAYGDGFDGPRVSIPTDWYRRADLSLIIKRAQLQDGGVYYCDMQKMHQHRSAVRLEVRQEVPKPPGRTPQPAPPPMLKESPHWTWITVLITAALTSVIVGPLVFFLHGWKLRHARDEETS